MSLHQQDVSSNSAISEDEAARPWDVLVVGGGIVGAGIARDAAIRGLRTLLVEQADFASGTSSRSSRLLHGGLRYLAQGRLALVREASKEKKIVGEIAPHLTEPLAFLFPTRRNTPWSYWKLSAGVKLYDLLCGMRNFGRSRSLAVRKVLELLPNLSEQGLTGAVRYYDALTNDSRLVIDSLRSSVAHGAKACNYTQLVSAEREGDYWACQLKQVSTGEQFRVLASVIVNATGPWSDKLPHSNTNLRLTKGVHLVVDKERLPVPDAVVLTEGDRILFAIPWGERVILGTTDTDYNGQLDEPTCEAEDVRYILDIVNANFPKAELKESNVISHWAGLRPLVADPHGNPSDISRRHEVSMSETGWLDVTGGKLTTYRLMAQEAVDKIGAFLQMSLPACETAKRPLLSKTDAGAFYSGILPPPVSSDVVTHCCREEWAQHLEDVMIRRTSWRYYHRDHLQIAEKVVQWMSEVLGWDTRRIESELEHYKILTALKGDSSN